MTIIIETERLVLRDINIETDLDMWAEMMADEDTVRYLGGKTMNRAQTWRYMAQVMGHKLIRGYSFMIAEEKSSGEPIGYTGPWNPEGWPEPEVGWAIHRNYWRRGYAKEMGAACVDYVFTTLGWDKVAHIIVDGNIASIKTAEAIGSKYIKSINGIPGTTDKKCLIYGQDNPKV